MWIIFNLYINDLESITIKQPTTQTLISSNSIGNIYTIDEDCWVTARTKTTDIGYAILTISDNNNLFYSSKEFACGIKDRTMLVKLYTKKGTQITVTGEGDISTIELYKLL